MEACVAEVTFDESIGESLYRIDDDDKSCDVVLVAEDGTEYRAYKAIIAMISPLFRKLFEDHKAPNDHVMRIIFRAVPSLVMKQFVNYAYDLPLDINPANVEVLTCFSNEFHVIGLLRLCCDYLIRHMNPSNALGIYSLAKHEGLPCNERLVRKYILSQFGTIAKRSNEFLQLTEEDLYSFLNDDTLNIKSEEVTFEILIKWIRADPEVRRHSITRLITCVRLGLLSFDYCVNKLSNNEYYIEAMNSEISKKYLLDARTYVKESENQILNDITFNFSYAKPRIPHEIIFAMGGWSTGNTTNFMETYDSRADRWFICTATPTNIRPAYHGMVYLDGLIYVIGGYDGTDYFSTVQTFCPESEEWHTVAPMHKPRCYVSVASWAGQIYALGGYNGIQRMACGESYDPLTNQWTMLPVNMHRQRSDACATAIKGKIFIVGGFNGEEITNTVEYFDIESQKWVEVRPMLSPRTGVRCVAYKNLLYVVGGFNGTSRLNTGEYYNLERCEWAEIPSMLCPRSNFMLIQMEGFIYAIGGFNGNTTISLVECYDCENREWTACCNMNIRRSALGACVAYGLSKAKYYTYHGQMGTCEAGKSQDEFELD